MTSLLQSLVEKAAFDNGWEIVENGRVFYSGRHPGALVATDLGRALQLEFVGTPENLLEVSFPALAAGDGSLVLSYEPGRFTAAVPALEAIFRTTAGGAAAEPPSVATERLATVKQRVGQSGYREDLFSLWDGACAVTGLADPALLRASHAKPWRDATDPERLDPFNGFPLCIPLDAIFDAGWITFSDNGIIALSPSLDPAAVPVFALDPAQSLRRAPSPRHLPYLAWHREHIFRKP